MENLKSKNKINELENAIESIADLSNRPIYGLKNR